MTEVPKIVYDRLRAAPPEQALPDQALQDEVAPQRAHPDADLLTAFAEQALTATERDGVLAHLALCDDCRDIVSLALPAADLVPTPIAIETDASRATASRTPAPRRSGFAWPSLRWAALAAAVVVAASVLVVRSGRRDHATLLSKVVPQVAATAAPNLTQPSASSMNQLANATVNQPATVAPTDEAKLMYELPSPKKLKAGKAPSLPIQGRSVTALLDTQNASGQTATLSAAGSAPAPLPNSPAMDATTAGARIMGRSSEAVEVSSQAVAVEATPSADDTLVARNDALPIEKAKPAPQESGANAVQMAESQKAALQTNSAVVGAASPAVAGRNVTSLVALTPASRQAPAVTWMITAGVLQRSLDGGQTWQNASHSDHPLLCYASYNADVWTGGQAGALFHSIDSGITWEQVRPSIKAQALSSDVTHIDLHGPAEIMVSTSNNEIWASVDGGKTWAKK
jgi:hypothetical protein